ncbi:hypothetical protein FNO01nite_25880 [Flavobacterium noncentrifugens]|uniref:Uncharacterized protein n=1 Tax=Flavobacterium noncentrifugens TaxID=1128970 RepID=A0A1G8ZI50_9FLAO|nr:hypothetical protein [Flavobacterium noncentrifugens]GEP51916.1 hypothetical protein FNO01nite_25880 [Flavobacterium noncentrifugens]SDK14792.1 hypothetical protein SAMN04487935_2611 [Flavobacterium noncentrifugens]
MNYNVQINAIESLDEIANYWTENDYRQLLELFDFPDSKSIKTENLLEMLQMAITDFEPAAAARVLLQYKLSEHLNEGQMDQMAHDMLLDKISEEYPDTSLHYALYNINQLLFKAFNGTFLNTKATLLDFTIDNNSETPITKAGLLRLLHHGMSPNNLVVRMFEEQLTKNVDFPDAESIVWELKTADYSNYQLITSEYWLSREDVVRGEFEGSIEAAG